MPTLMEQAQGFAARPPGPQAAGSMPPRRPGPPGRVETDEGERGGADFQRPDISALIPKGQEDAVARIVAAGMKIMYSPEAQPEVQAALEQGGELAQVLAMNVTGLILTLDQKSQGGLPVEAIFPAAMELLGEACEVFEAAGKPVSQSDYADAARLMMLIIAKKMGASDEQIMGELSKQAQGGPAAAGAAPAEGAEVPS